MDLMISIEQEILRLLEKNGGMYRADIFAACPEADNANQVSYALNTLLKAGRVAKGPRQDGRGSVWSLPEQKAPQQIVVVFPLEEETEAAEPEMGNTPLETPVTVNWVEQAEEADLPPIGFAEELSEAQKAANAQDALDNPPFSDVYMALDRLEQKVLFAEMHEGIRDKQLKCSVLEKLAGLLEPSIADLLEEVVRDLEAIPDAPRA